VEGEETGRKGGGVIEKEYVGTNKTAKLPGEKIMPRVRQKGHCRGMGVKRRVRSFCVGPFEEGHRWSAGG